MLIEELDNEGADAWITTAREMAHAWEQAAAEPAASGRAAPTHDDAVRPFMLDALNAVLRPQTMGAAAAAAHDLAPDISAALPWTIRSLVRAGGAFAPVLPAAVIPASRRALRRALHTVVLDATPARLDAALATIAAGGHEITLMPLAGEPAGDDEASDRRDQLASSLARTDIEAVRVRARSIIGLRSDWAHDDVVDELAAHIETLRHGGLARWEFIIDRVEDVDLTLDVFERTLSGGGQWGLSFAVSVPQIAAALPRALKIVAAAERALPVRIILDTAVDAAADAAVAERRGWERTADDDSVAQAAALLRAVDVASGAPGIMLAIADTDLQRIAAAWAWADDHDEARAEIEVAIADRDKLAPVIASATSAVRLLAPIAHPGQDDAALAAYVRRRWAPVMPPSIDDLLERAVAAAPAVAAQRGPDRTAEPTSRPDTRLTRTPSTGDDGLTQEVIGIAQASVVTETSPIAPEAADLLFGGAPFVETAVFQDRESGAPARGVVGFRAAADTDAANAANRDWIRAVLGSIPEVAEREQTARDDDLPLAKRVADLHDGAGAWASTPGVERAAVLRRFATELESARGSLIAIAAADTDVLPRDVDDEVSAAVDSATFSASLAGELDAISGAVFVPARVTVVEVGVDGALADLADGLASALAAGSAVVLYPLPLAEGIADALMDTALRAGVPSDLITVAAADEEDPLALTDVDQLIISAPADRIDAVRAAHPTLRITARADGPGVAIVSPTADLDQAAIDIVCGAFAGAGRSRAATNAVIVLGSAGRSRRFAARLADVARTFRPGYTEDPRAQFGPVTEDEQTRWALTQLEDGESWLVQPQQSEERLWSGGVRIGLQHTTRFLSTRIAAPVIGVIAADVLSDAIRWQNDADAATATLFTRSVRDLGYWLHEVKAGSLFVNTPAVPGRAQRRPVPAWSSRSVGTAMAPGGSNRLVGLGSWRAVGSGIGSNTLHLRGLDSRITALIEAVQGELDLAGFDRVRRGALSDAVAWDREFGRVKDVTGLRTERNLLRYRRVPVVVRASEEAPLADVMRVVVAGVRAHSEMTLSLPVGMPAGIRHALGEQGVPVFLESDDEWLERLRASNAQRVRLVGAVSTEVLAALTAAEAVTRVDVYADDVTIAGRLELLPFLREQSVTIAADRDGAPDRWSEQVI